MATINPNQAVTLSLSIRVDAASMTDGWESDAREMMLSLLARLDEFYGDDGGAYAPAVIIHGGYAHDDDTAPATGTAITREALQLTPPSN